MELSVDVIHVAKNIAETIYQELSDGMNELRKRELAQKIAIELTNKICNSIGNSKSNAWFEYDLWCEYELILSSEARKKIYEILQNIK